MKQKRGTGVPRTHGETGSPTYICWANMIQRCTNPNSTYFHNYGGRGIKVCERWKVYANFRADMGEKPVNLTLDRYPDNDGNYEPGNCRWATRTEQNLNQRKPKEYVITGGKITPVI